MSCLWVITLGLYCLEKRDSFNLKHCKSSVGTSTRACRQHWADQMGSKCKELVRDSLQLKVTSCSCCIQRLRNWALIQHL
ncbi:hypothetical protein NL676_033034 [Syzygium grande]|nr:hypothetical protein NL676_033034 [Syzygium grande]